MGKYNIQGTIQGKISMQRLLDTLAMIIEKRENVKVTFKILNLEKQYKEEANEET